MKKNKTRSFFCVLLSFVLFLLLLAMTVSVFLEATLMNASYADRIVVKSDYVSLLTAELQKTMIGWGELSGVKDAAVFTSVVTESRVMKDTRQFVEHIYTGEIDKTIRTEMQEDLKQSIGAYAAAQNATDITPEELAENVSAMAEICVKEYTDLVMISGMYGMCSGFNQIRPYLTLTIVLFAVLCAAVVWLLQRLTRRLTSVLRYGIYALTASAMALWGAYAYIVCSQVMTRIAVTQPSMYLLMNDTVATLTGTWMGVAVVATLLLAVLLTVYFMLAFGYRGKRQATRTRAIDRSMLLEPEDK